MAGPGMETPNALMVVFSDTVTAGFDALSGSVMVWIASCFMPWWWSRAPTIPGPAPLPAPAA